MSKLSLQLQSRSLREMAGRETYTKKLAGFEYSVSPKVYKGSTDTELFCKLLATQKGQEIWDIGTGTGLIALQAKKNGAKYVLATDINPAAVRNAKENSERLGLKIEVKRADVFGNIKKKFDVITFNPPFTDQKAKRAHDVSFWDKNHITLRKFFKNLGKHLKKNGKAFVAWSSFGDTRKLKKIAREYNLTLSEVGRKKGKRNFVYYVYQINPDNKKTSSQGLSS